MKCDFLICKNQRNFSLYECKNQRQKNQNVAATCALPVCTVRPVPVRRPS